MGNRHRDPPSDARVDIVIVLFLGCASELEVTIRPAQPTTTDDLRLRFAGTHTDIRWRRDGRQTGGDLRITADRTKRDERWRATVTTMEGAVGTASVVIANTSPTLQASLPTIVGDDDVIRPEVITDDIDGDDVFVRWSWMLDGVEVATTDSIAAADTEPGQHWVGIGRPDDGSLTGVAVEVSTVVDNQPPSVLSVVLPEVVVEQTVVEPVVVTDDPDGHDVTVSLTWTVNGVEVWNGASLTGIRFDRGDHVAVTALPHDGFIEGEPVTSDGVVVANSRPELSHAFVPEVRIGSIPTCTAFGWFDADGDEQHVLTSWTTNGAAGLQAFVKGDVLACTLVPYDGIDAGTPVSASRTVLNTPPELSVSIQPSSPLAGELMTAVSSWQDPDGDDVTVTYEWRLDGLPVSTSSLYDGGAAGQEVSVTATADDGEAVDVATDSVVLGIPPDTADSSDTGP